MLIFEVKDKSGRLICLSDERWKHVLKHPEMQDKFIIERVKDTLVRPDTITSEEYDLNKRLYYKYYKDQKRYLLVSVKYLNGKGFIISSFYTDKIK